MKWEDGPGEKEKKTFLIAISFLSGRNVKNGARIVTKCNAMQRNENHFGRVTFVRACYHHHHYHYRRRRRRVAQRYETHRAARGLGDATVTPTDLKPVRPAAGVGRIRRLDVIDPNRSRPTTPAPPQRCGVRACDGVTAFSARPARDGRQRLFPPRRRQQFQRVR